MWQQAVQHQSLQTELATRAENKDTYRPIALVKAKEEDTKVASINKTCPAQRRRKGKVNSQASHHDLKAIVIIAGSMVTSVIIADNLLGLKILNNSSGPKMKAGHRHHSL